MTPPDPDPNAEAITPTTPDEEAFVNNLVARGQAAERGADGNLPPGATHEIVGRTESGAPIVRRVRFSGRPY